MYTNTMVIKKIPAADKRLLRRFLLQKIARLRLQNKSGIVCLKHLNKVIHGIIFFVAF